MISATEDDAGCGKGRMISPPRKWLSAATGTLRSTQDIGVAGISKFVVTDQKLGHFVAHTLLGRKLSLNCLFAGRNNN